MDRLSGASRPSSLLTPKSKQELQSAQPSGNMSKEDTDEESDDEYESHMELEVRKVQSKRAQDELEQKMSAPRKRKKTKDAELSKEEKALAVLEMIVARGGMKSKLMFGQKGEVRQEQCVVLPSDGGIGCGVVGGDCTRQKGGLTAASMQQSVLKETRLTAARLTAADLSQS